MNGGFKGVTKEEYEAMTAEQRVFIARGNLSSIEELDEFFGCHTDIGTTDEEKDEFYRKYYGKFKRVGHMVAESMAKEGLFKMPEGFTGNSENKNKEEKMNKTEKIMEELNEAGFQCAIAVATEAEINAGAACGQLAIIEEE